MSDRASFDQAVDALHQITDRWPPNLALAVLTTHIMGIIPDCADPHRALLGVIAQLTQLVRMGEATSRDKALPLDDWVREAWRAR